MSAWLELSNIIHNLEEVKVPFPSSKAFLITALVGVPVGVLLHDTSSYWMPKTKASSLPVVSWFLRKWSEDPENKRTHLRILRNAVVFGWFACVMNEKDYREVPVDYVADRVSSTSARRVINNEIMKARGEIFSAASQVVGQEAFDGAKAAQQRDAALRRRHAHDSRSQLV